MSNNRKIISFRDCENIIEFLDAKARKLAVDRSDVLRMLVREKQQSEADSATNELAERYKKFK
jgi:hypothetical protein